MSIFVRSEDHQIQIELDSGLPLTFMPTWTKIQLNWIENEKENQRLRSGKQIVITA